MSFRGAKRRGNPAPSKPVTYEGRTAPPGFALLNPPLLTQGRQGGLRIATTPAESRNDRKCRNKHTLMGVLLVCGCGSEVHRHRAAADREGNRRLCAVDVKIG